MTNFIMTDQSRSKCAESASLTEATCTDDSDCQNKPYLSNANGRWTGRCLFSSKVNHFNQTNNSTKQSTGLCQMEGKMIHWLFFC